MYTNSSVSIFFGKIFHSKFKYRDRATIIGDILNSINKDPKGKTKTSVMRSANLNLEQTNRYLNLLQLCDFIKATDPLNSQEDARYRLTEKGFSLIRNFETWRYALKILYSKQY